MGSQHPTQFRHSILGPCYEGCVLQMGIPALVLEGDSELRLEGSAINLWSNAFRALDALGIAQPLLDSHPALSR